MDSIHRQQAEDHLHHLSAHEAVAKIKHIVDKAKTCFFCTYTDEGVHSRPMSVQQVDDAGNLWFLSADDSHKNLEVVADPAVKLYFQGSPHSDFLQLDGYATVSRDKDKIKELWEFTVKTWFTEGVDDPRITVIRVQPSHGYYWDTKHGNAVAGIKILIGAATGRTLDDSEEGNLDL